MTPCVIEMICFDTSALLVHVPPMLIWFDEHFELVVVVLIPIVEFASVLFTADMFTTCPIAVVGTSMNAASTKPKQKGFIYRYSSFVTNIPTAFIELTLN